jgi:NADPH-dependent ferric siderophore reductase
MTVTEQAKNVTKPRPRVLELLRSTPISPYMIRLTFGGEDLAGFPENSNGAHIKLFLKRPDQEQLHMPELTPDGPIWPPRELRPSVRTFTVRSYRSEQNELDMDFVLHGDNGPASSFAINAQPGACAGISMPARHETRLFNADWVLLNGDLSALPAISAYLESLPAATQGYAFIEVPDASAEIAIETQSQVKIVWLHQNGVRPSQSRLMIEAVQALDWPSDRNTFAWLAGESSAVVAVRNYLMERYSIAREDMYTVPYWKDGHDEEAYHHERHRIMDGEE